MADDRHSDALVLFGASGDLAKKMTFPSLYKLEQRGVLKVPVVGVAFTDWDDEQMRQHAREAIVGAGVDLDETTFRSLAARMRFVKGDYGEASTFEAVKSAIGGARRPLFYLEIHRRFGACAQSLQARLDQEPVRRADRSGTE